MLNEWIRYAMDQVCGVRVGLQPYDFYRDLNSNRQMRLLPDKFWNVSCPEMMQCKSKVTGTPSVTSLLPQIQ